MGDVFPQHFSILPEYPTSSWLSGASEVLHKAGLDPCASVCTLGGQSCSVWAHKRTPCRELSSIPKPSPKPFLNQATLEAAQT